MHSEVSVVNIVFPVLTDSVPLVCYLNNASEFGEYLSRNLSLNQTVVDGILGATVNTSKV